MSNDRDDAQGRQETTPLGWEAGGAPGQPSAPPDGGSSAVPHTEHTGDQPTQDQPAYGQSGHWQPAHGQIPYGQPAYGQPAYGQTPQGQAPYGQNPYAQPSYGQNPYGQPPFAQPSYAQPSYAQQYGVGPYGQDPYQQAQPARPGTVITAAVLGLVHGALGLLVTVGLLAGGAFFDDLVQSLAEADPSVEADVAVSEIDSVRAALVLLAVLALAWTVVMVWGSVLALRGRSRVLLVVGSSIAVAASGLFFLIGLVSALGGPAEQGETGGLLFLLVLFLAALAMLVLICLRSAGRFFAAHRQRRALGLR